MLVPLDGGLEQARGDLHLPGTRIAAPCAAGSIGRDGIRKDTTTLTDESERGGGSHEHARGRAYVQVRVHQHYSDYSDIFNRK